MLVMEYWTGWFDSWGGPHYIYDADGESPSWWVIGASPSPPSPSLSPFLTTPLASHPQTGSWDQSAGVDSHSATHSVVQYLQYWGHEGQRNFWERIRLTPAVLEHHQAKGYTSSVPLQLPVDDQ